jgi:hypothetical protein
MSLEGLSMVLCLASGIFGRPAWSTEMCEARASQILKISQENDLDPLLLVAVNIHECDMRENVRVRFYSSASGGVKKKTMGVDSCPMGIRSWWQNGKSPKTNLTPVELYELAGKKMARVKKLCQAKRHKHHYISHWNYGNRTYSVQILGIRAALEGKSTILQTQLTPRSKEIIKRLLRIQQDLRS